MPSQERLNYNSQKFFDPDRLQDSSKKKTTLIAKYLVALSLVLAIIITLALTSRKVLKSEINSSPCKKPSFRREWLSLSTAEKREYIQSVTCLQTQPSQIGMNHSLYDDFPYVHNQQNCKTFCPSQKGRLRPMLSISIAHGAAEFLAWHRYFLLTYENTLKQQCNYSGSLP